LFRLRNAPQRFTVPVSLQIGTGERAVLRSLREYDPLGRLDFDFDFAKELSEYLSGPDKSLSCGADELLTNGDFALPVDDDAARTLFGFDAAGGRVLSGAVDLARGVNLSTRRFLLLSVDQRPPIRIDCAGRDPARTRPEEIVTAINRTMRSAIASTTDPAEGPVRLELGSKTGSDPGTEFRLHPWRQPGAPNGWQWEGPTASVVRIKLPTRTPFERAGPLETAPTDIVAALEASATKPSVLFQRIPAIGSCEYELSFLFFTSDSADSFYTVLDQLSWDASELPTASTSRSSTPPRWEVRWSNASGEVLRQDLGELASSLPGASNRISNGEVETRLVAPVGTAQAEIRLIQPPTGVLILANLSFKPVLDALTNGDFRRWHAPRAEETSSLLGWTLAGGWIDEAVDEAIESGGELRTVKLGGNGPEDSILSQVVEITPGHSYSLLVRAQSGPLLPGDPLPLPLERRARLELRWLGQVQPGAPLVLPLDARDFSGHAWSGQVPAGASGAEIRLIQPRGQASLSVQSVSLSRLELASVPLVFLSEAPGELTISNLRVAYDQPGPHYLHDKNIARSRTRSLLDPQPPSLLTPSVQPAQPQPEADVSLPLADHPIAIIAGVGEHFQQILGALSPPITTVAELAALDPNIEAPGLPRERGLALKTAAEMLLEVSLPPSPFIGLAAEPLDTLLVLTIAGLAEQHGLDAAWAEHLQRKLRTLRLFLKNAEFSKLHLSDVTLTQESPGLLNARSDRGVLNVGRQGDRERPTRPPSS
jgi:hypothetical protein